MKKYALIPLLAALAMNVSADDTVRFTINGEITARTCSLVTTGDRTITMQSKDISLFTNQPVGYVLFGGVTDKATVSCPATTSIKLSYADLAPGAPATATNHLKNTAAAGTSSANVGVQVWFLRTPTDSGFTMNTKTEREFRAKSGTDYTTLSNVDIHVKPHYYVMATPVTPGLVRSQMALTISYQ